MTCPLKPDLRPTALRFLMGETNKKLISFKLPPLLAGVILTPNSCTDAINRVSPVQTRLIASLFIPITKN